MILVKPSTEIMEIMGVDIGDLGSKSLNLIEKAGRVCYKSEDRISIDSSKKFVQRLTNMGHESVIEHSAMTIKFIVDRGVSHELVRHRLCAFSQESTRYCNYKGGVTFIIPSWVDIEPGEYDNDMFTPFNQRGPAYVWLIQMLEAENSYIELLNYGWSPQQARSVLPNSLKTEIVVTANFREWKHIFNLRCAKAAHPQMREVMIPLWKKIQSIIPIIFDDCYKD